MSQSTPLCTRIPFAISPLTILAVAVIGGLPLTSWTQTAAAQGDDDTADTVRVEDEGPPKEVVETDPIVLAFRDIDATTLSQLARAVQAMYGIRRADEAKVYLDKIKTLNATEADLANLAREMGGRLFIAMRVDEEFEPEGREFAESVLAAYGAELNDAARLANLASRRAGGERGTLQGLVEAGQLAVPALIGELGQAKDEVTEARLVATLIRIGPAAIHPLTASLTSGDDAIISGVAKTLGKLGDPRTAKHLIGPGWDQDLDQSTQQVCRQAVEELLNQQQISQADAERFLVKRVLDAYRNVQGREVGEYDNIWIWDEAASTVRRQSGHRRAGSLVLAAKLASDLAKLRPQDGPVQNLAISARLGAAKALVEPGSPLIVADAALYAEVQRLDPTQLLQVLTYSLENQQDGAATAACEVLGRMGPSIIAVDGARKPLLQAVRSPNRRLQFAACRAIMETTDGDTDFAGSSRWLSRVGFFLSSKGVSKAVVADPVDVRGQTLTGMLNEQGIATIAVKTGSALIAAVVGDPDVELILIHERMNGPVVAETVQLLRGDYRTRAIPVAILKDGGDDLANDRIAETDALTIAVPRPVSPEFASVIIGRLKGLNHGTIPVAAERHRQAEMAVTWIERQTADGANHWQLEQLEKQITLAVGNPDLAPRAAELLGRLANVGSQRRLLELINNDSASDEARTAALDAFDATIKSKGILLGGTEIRVQMNLAKARRDDSIIQEAFATLLKRLTEEK